MYRLVKTTTYTDLRNDLTAAQQTCARLEAECDAVRQRLDAVDAARVDAERGSARADGAMEVLRAQHLLDTEDRVVLRALLRTARRRQRQRVYVLFRHGVFHSVHESEDSAEHAAEAEGASPNGWTRMAAGTPAGEAAWRVQSLPLGEQQK
ncbi:hypothetical protein [Streptomyces sp. WMMC905]|uniref:hypothetical protein n=1 Tax=Streptomyces sp. WMMC905 TaxID=3404123 RepID=UPI003B9654B3